MPPLVFSLDHRVSLSPCPGNVLSTDPVPLSPPYLGYLLSLGQEFARDLLTWGMCSPWAMTSHVTSICLSSTNCVLLHGLQTGLDTTETKRKRG